MIVNFIDEITNDIDSNPKEYRSISMDNLSGVSNGVEISKLGNVLFYKYLPNSLHTSICKLSINGRTVRITDREKAKLEIAFHEWLKSATLEMISK